MENIFYVYGHWRSDTDACFYVGKGHGKRAYEMRRRNDWHRKVQNFLHNNGQSVVVKMIAVNLSEQNAFDMEMDIIIRRKANGDCLVNMTLGGDGVRGHKHSEATRAKLSAISAKQHRPCLDETKSKIKAAQIGKPRGPNPAHSERLRGRKLSDEHRNAISKGNTGRKVSDITRKKIIAANTGQKRSAETREKLSVLRKGCKDSEKTRRAKSIASTQSWSKIDRESHRVNVKAALACPQRRALMSEKMTAIWAERKRTREA